jgi:soluble lytic murein transglycosylase-like protein
MKSLKRLLLVLLILWVIPLDGWAEIIIRQDKDGNLTITNEPTPYKKKGPKVYKKRSGGITFVPAATSLSKVPRKYLQKIKQLSQKYGVKESLIIAVARAESGFNPFAVSRKGAVGIMQLMADTAVKYGVVNRYNADQNLEAGVRHLKYLYKKYNSNIPLTLAAYNAGETAVEKYKGVPPYKETRTFIKRVMNYMGMTYSSFYNSKFSTKIYQYRTKDGRIMITDSYPTNAEGPITVIE